MKKFTERFLRRLVSILQWSLGFTIVAGTIVSVLIGLIYLFDQGHFIIATTIIIILIGTIASFSNGDE